MTRWHISSISGEKETFNWWWWSPGPAWSRSLGRLDWAPYLKWEMKNKKYLKWEINKHWFPELHCSQSGILILHVYLFSPRESGQQAWRIRSRRGRGLGWRGWDSGATGQRTCESNSTRPTKLFYDLPPHLDCWIASLPPTESGFSTNLCCAGRVTGARAAAAFKLDDDDKDETNIYEPR